MVDLGNVIEETAAAISESARLDFKSRFDPASAGDWCAIVKDIVAMANSDGGCLIFGVNDDGTPSGWDPAPLLTLDVAKVTDKIASYSGVQFASITIRAAQREGVPVALLAVEEAPVPIMFTNPGTFAVADKQKIAFGRGTLYVRHGAKSEPATTEDLRAKIDRRRREERESLLTNVRKVFEAPLGQQIIVVPLEAASKSVGAPVAVRLTSDPAAPAYRATNPDETHPHRQREVVAGVNARLEGRVKINGHDVQCVRRAHNIDASRPDLSQKRRFGSTQYSDQFVEWIAAQFEGDPAFFDKARLSCKPRTQDGV